MAAASDEDKARRFRDAALPFLDDVFTLARYLMRNETDAEDAVQECYLRALRHFDSYRGPAIKPWLLAILRNVCKAEFARRSACRRRPKVGTMSELRTRQRSGRGRSRRPKWNCYNAVTGKESAGSLPNCRSRSVRPSCCGTSTIYPIARSPKWPAFPSAP